MVDKLGPKKTLLTLALPQIISWILIILARNLITLCIARIIGGISYGAVICSNSLYLSEIDKINRGRFMVLAPLLLNIGIVTTLFLGSYLPYLYMNIILLMVPILFFITFIFIPDHFDEENKNEEMMNMNFQEPEEVETETEEEENKIKKNKFKIKETRLWKLFTFSSNQRALIILTILSSHLIFSGDALITTYAQQILTYSGSAISGKNSAIIIESMKTIGCLISTQVVEKFGRKVLFMSTGIMGSICMGLVGIYFFLEKQQVDISSIKWMPVFCLAFYNIIYPIGEMSIFIIYQTELFTQDVKSLSVLYSNILYMVFFYLGLFKFQKIISFFGSGNLFFMFALYGALATFIVFIITPETKGKSLEEIQVVMKSRRKFFCSF